jgi:hypothetical protein
MEAARTLGGGELSVTSFQLPEKDKEKSVFQRRRGKKKKA